MSFASNGGSAAEDVDERSWQELFDENLALKGMVRQLVEAKQSAASSSSSTAKPTDQEQQIAESNEEKPPTKREQELLLELTTLRAESLQFNRFQSRVDEGSGEMSKALQSARDWYRQRYGDELVSETSSNGSNNSTGSSLLVKHIKEAVFREDGRPPPPRFVSLTNEIDECVAFFVERLPAVLRKSAEKSRAALEAETQDLQRLIADLSGRLFAAQEALKQQQESSSSSDQMNAEAQRRIDALCQEMEEKLEAVRQEKSTVEQQRDAAKALQSDAQRKLEQLAAENEHKLRQQTRMTSLLSAQLQRSQKQLETMTAEIQSRALNQNNSGTTTRGGATTAATTINTRPRAGSLGLSGGLPHSAPEVTSVSTFAPLDPAAAAAASLVAESTSSSSSFSETSSPLQQQQQQPRRERSNSNSGTAATAAAGFEETLRHENTQLIHRLAATQERVWSLEMANKALEEEVIRLTDRVKQQATVIRVGCGVLSSGGASSSSSSTLAATTTRPTATASAAASSTPAPPTSSSGFASLFSRGRSNTTTTAPTSLSNSAVAGRGAGFLPIEIVHVSHLQTALEDALASAAKWKELAEGATPVP